MIWWIAAGYCLCAVAFYAYIVATASGERITKTARKPHWRRTRVGKPGAKALTSVFGVPRRLCLMPMHAKHYSSTMH